MPDQNHTLHDLLTLRGLFFASLRLWVSLTCQCAKRASAIPRVVRPPLLLPFPLLLLLFCFLTAAPAIAVAADDQHVVASDPLTPEEQLGTFQLPDGLRIQLFAAEPEIQKPINMAFDARGRLWVTSTVEYPYAVAEGKIGRDSIRILEDVDGDGRSDKSTVFADGLNIPFGIYPCHGGAVAFSISNIYLFRDGDGDDRADSRELLYGPFDSKRDTHGQNNGFVRGFDGWIYACHGFANETEVRGRDGHTIRMGSGNTYRFRPDGSRIENFTYGQVNPFGMAVDAAGELFTADCHSKPLTYLMRGGYSPSFGKPHDGLGFVPPLMEHGHGSTGLAGAACYIADRFPPEFMGNFFCGNVITNRVHRDVLEAAGSTLRARELPDLVVSSDRWFRPVDIALGPDGAIYIADFYNRIIGHYEVPLDHPGRDRDRGRIWRVTYAGGTNSTERPSAFRRLDAGDVNSLLDTLGHPNLTVRRLAMDQLSDRIGSAAIPAVRTRIRAAHSPDVAVHGLWVLHRLGALDQQQLVDAFRSSVAGVRRQAMRLAAEGGPWTDGTRRAVMDGLLDPDPFVRRAAADALGVHHSPEHVRPLIELVTTGDAEDTWLRHAGRIALRNQFLDPQTWLSFEASKLDADEALAIADVAVGVRSAEAAAFLLECLQGHRFDNAARMIDALRHAAAYIDSTKVDPLAAVAERLASENVDLQSDLLRSVIRGHAERGLSVSEAVRQWGLRLVARLIEEAQAEEKIWSAEPIPGSDDGGSPWGIARRPAEESGQGVRMLSSLESGEQRTGILRSRTFVIPRQLSFYLAGHAGRPEKPAITGNLARLRLADDESVIAEAGVPRSDAGRKITWDLTEVAGREGYLELVDGSSERSFAWLAAGGFDPQVVAVPELSPSDRARRETAAAEIAAELRLQQSGPLLVELAAGSAADRAVRAAAVRALVAIEPDDRLAALADVIDDGRIAESLRQSAIRAVIDRGEAEVVASLREVFKSGPASVQSRVAERLAASQAGAELLLAEMESGAASARLLESPRLVEMLGAVLPAAAAARAERLRGELPPHDARMEQLAAKRREQCLAESGSTDRGEQVFMRHCGACHQFQGRGTVVGPQLDGIGQRGLDRLIEDIIDPNRNVDVAFRTSLYQLHDGRSVSGLLRREEGRTWVLADNQGREVVVSQDDVAEEKKLPISIMPDNWGEVLAADEFRDLVTFLLDPPQSSAAQSPLR